MASLQKFPSGTYHITFWFGGKRYKRSLKTRNYKKAVTARGRLEETIQLIEQGRLQIPDGTDLPVFLLSEGKLESKPVSPTSSKLSKLFDDYFDSIPVGSIEPDTIKMKRTHRKNLEKYFGANFDFGGLKFSNVQDYVTKRSKDPGLRGKPLSADTIKKELVTLRGLWKWCIALEKFPEAEFPSKGLQYPKTEELPPFRTLEEVLKLSKSVEPKSDEEAELWSSVFLDLDEIRELLRYVKSNATHEFDYPLFVFAAHTGARRSELIRSELPDLDIETLIIREKKRKKRKKSTRRVPVSPMLRDALRAWLNQRPTSPFTFCHTSTSSLTREEGEPILKGEMQRIFDRALKGSRFEKLCGWHVFRHSFCSNCAAKGIDQRVIDSWVGHTTEEMRQRYRHLFPNTEKTLHQSVFQ